MNTDEQLQNTRSEQEQKQKKKKTALYSFRSQ